MAFQCSICSQELKDRVGRASCFFCGNEEDADWTCPQGHYVCEDCRTACPEEMVVRVASATQSQDPLAIATMIMSHSSFTTAGPEHHLVVAPAVLAAMRNAGADSVPPAGAVTEALDRARGIPLGACASRGDCGGAIGAGIAVSIVSGATPIRGKQRSMVLRASACASLALADMGGARCCKQAVFCGIEAAWDSLRSSLVPTLPALAKPTCSFSSKQRDCKRKACPYHA